MISDAELTQAQERLERFSTLTDARFTIPFTRIRFGLDALIGLIPFVGDLIGFVLSLYLFAEAQKLGIPNSVKIKMLGNIVVDLLIGLIPVLGDVGDIGFRANIRNTRLIVDCIESERARRQAENEEKESPYLGVLILLVITIVVGAAIYLVPYSLP